MINYVEMPERRRNIDLDAIFLLVYLNWQRFLTGYKRRNHSLRLTALSRLVAQRARTRTLQVPLIGPQTLILTKIQYYRKTCVWIIYTPIVVSKYIGTFLVVKIEHDMHAKNFKMTTVHVHWTSRPVHDAQKPTAHIDRTTIITHT